MDNHGYSIRARRTVGRLCGNRNIRMDDAVKSVPRDLVRKHDLGQSRAIQRAASHNPVTKLARDICERGRPRLNDAPGQHVVIDDTRTQFAKTRRRSRLSSADAAREPDP